MSTEEPVYWCPPRFYGPAQAVVVTERLMDTAQALAEGMSNRQIGRWLGLTEDTVKSHVKNLLMRTRCADRHTLNTAMHSRRIVLVVT